MARLQRGLERIVYAIGMYEGVTPGLLSPIQRLLLYCNGYDP